MLAVAHSPRPRVARALLQLALSSCVAVVAVQSAKADVSEPASPFVAEPSSSADGVNACAAEQAATFHGMVALPTLERTDDQHSHEGSSGPWEPELQELSESDADGEDLDRRCRETHIDSAMFSEQPVRKPHNDRLRALREDRRRTRPPNS
jgi:hypothetical protein